MANAEKFFDQLILDRARNSLTILSQDQPLLQGATAEVGYRVKGEKRRLSLLEEREGNKERVMRNEFPHSSLLVPHPSSPVSPLSRANDDVKLDWHVATGQRVEMWLEVSNVGSAPLQIDELVVLTVAASEGGAIVLGQPAGNWRFYQNGWQSWSPAFARRVGDGTYVELDGATYLAQHLPHGLLGRQLASEWVTVISSKQNNLLLGFVTTADQLSEIRLRLDRESNFSRLTACCYADGITLAPGESLKSERLEIGGGDSPPALLEGYAEVVKETMKARPAKPIPTGWCSWYYYFGENKAGDVLDNLAAATKTELPLEYILIDDGYQTAIGDWLSIDEEKFSQGMRSLAEEIRAAGHRPGIWTAPFAASSQSQLYTEYPDWVIRDERGDPIVAWQHWGVDTYGLDLSHSEVQEWLGETFRTMRGWGYELFKVDFLYAGAVAGCRHDPRVTRAQAVRKGLEIIREAIGEEAFLLGCGAPLGPSVGLVDGMRIGPDVAINWHPFWADLTFPAAENALRNSITRYFTHGRFWINDPDCVLVRQKEDRSALTLSEMRTLATVVGLSGGIVLSSDNLPTLADHRLNYLAKLLPPYGIAARPLDLFESEIPRLLALPIETDFGRWLMLAAINWEEQITAATLDLSEIVGGGPHHIFDFWSERYLGLVRGHLKVRQLPHATRLLLLKEPPEHPDLLASTFHLTGGAVEVKVLQFDGRCLTLEMEKAGTQYGKLFFLVPEPYQVASVKFNGRRRGWQKVVEGVIWIGFHLLEEAKVEIDFRVAG
jgi:alpha-galactosidase